MGLLHHGWYDEDEIVDIPVYEAYGTAIEGGAVPYRDFRPEYPPGALPAFVVPALAERRPGGLPRRLRVPDGRSAASRCVLLAAVALAGSARRERGPSAALALVAGFPLLLGSVVLTRFDLCPAALVAGALAALVTERDRLGFGLLGAAVAVKLYPAVLVPLALALRLAPPRPPRGARLPRRSAAAVVALAFLPFLVLAPDGVAHSFGRQLRGRSRSRASARRSPRRPPPGRARRRDALRPRLAEPVRDRHRRVAAVLLSSLAARRPRLDLAAAAGPAEELVRWSAAALVAFVALGKVLSPQFLIWLVPLVPLVAGRRGLRASVAARGSRSC